MKKFEFKSVFDIDSLQEFPEELDYEIVCSKEEAPDIPSILDKFGYSYPSTMLGDEEDDFYLDIENDFDYDIIDAYEESVSLRMKRKTEDTTSQLEVAEDDASLIETEKEEQSDDDGGTTEKESAN